MRMQRDSPANGWKSTGARKVSRDQRLASSLMLVGESRCGAGKYAEAEPVLRESAALWGEANRSAGKDSTQPLFWEGPGRTRAIAPRQGRSGRGIEIRGSRASAPVGLRGPRCGNAMPHAQREKFIPESLRRIVALYESWGREEKAKAWKDKLMHTCDESPGPKGPPSPPAAKGGAPSQAAVKQ